MPNATPTQALKDALFSVAHESRLAKKILFLSVSDGKARAFVACGVGYDMEQAWRAAYARLRAHAPFEKNDWRWLKADLVCSGENYKPDDLLARIQATRPNYFRCGIAFDPEFKHAALEQEINGNAAFPKDPENEERSVIKLSRLSRYFEEGRKLPPLAKNIKQKDAWFAFDTIGFFVALDEPEATPIRLQTGGYGNGTRPRDDQHVMIPRMAINAARFLATQIKPDGLFYYGWFPVFHKPIESYNILRHCSTLYAMLEAWEISHDPTILEPIPRALDYVVQHAMIRKNIDGTDCSFMIDYASDDELKLGGQAMFILTVCKYATLTGDRQYLAEAQRVAEGMIRCFIDPNTGAFTHVLRGEELALKERFRIVYYDGEAVFALLRLYAVDRNPRWLETAKFVFERFIATDHWKYHDHWLSYCTNELTQYVSDDRYFLFGLNNVFGHLRFIEERDTAYPTLLELVMAACLMIKRMVALDKTYLLEGYDVARLFAGTDHRANHQGHSYFFPEMAMYFKEPGAIENAFYTRHHSFRVRIDDIEHFISGYVHYWLDGLMSGKYASARDAWQAMKPLDSPRF